MLRIGRTSVRSTIIVSAVLFLRILFGHLLLAYISLFHMWADCYWTCFTYTFVWAVQKTLFCIFDKDTYTFVWAMQKTLFCIFDQDTIYFCLGYAKNFILHIWPGDEEYKILIRMLLHVKICTKVLCAFQSFIWVFI